MPTQMWFSERMTGYFARKQTDPRVGEERGRQAKTWFGFELTMHMSDLDQFIADPNHKASVEGHYVGNLFAGEPKVLSGTFNFMSKGSGRERLMEHHHEFESGGKKYYFEGFKYIDDDPLAWDNIGDLTTLYSRIYDDQRNVIAAGVLHFPMVKFPALVASFTTRGTGDELEAKAKFLEFFMREEVRALVDGAENPPAPANRRRELSRAHHEIAARYDLVVVGSGYGAGPIAARLAGKSPGGAKKKVAVLERGREWRAGDFPEQAWNVPDLLEAPWSPEGLLEVHLAKDIRVVCGNGLGGTSLINASVMIEAPTDVFARADWPAGLPDMAPYYKRARDVLRPSKDPSPPLKSDVFRDAVKATMNHPERDVVVADVAVTFEPNVVRSDTGNSQTSCIDCGNCVTGCNYTSKNTVDMTYLSIAEKAGAEIFSQIEVRTVAKTSTGYALDCLDHATGSSVRVEADKVVLSAGTMGTFKILQRSSQHNLLAVSDALGAEFSGNGDVLGFGYNNDRRTDPWVGPTITTVAHYRDDPEPRNHFVIEEGGVPRALKFALRQFLPWIEESGVDTDHGWVDAFKEWLREKADQFGFENRGALAHSLIYLAVGTEESSGTMRLDNDSIKIDWPGVSNAPFAQRIDDKMLEITSKIGGTYIKNREPRSLFMNRLITVHPLGGCVMAETIDAGVVNVHGEVFGHEGGLYVSDASIIPTPLGVNPALTIAALGEWIADGIAASWAT